VKLAGTRALSLVEQLVAQLVVLQVATWVARSAEWTEMMSVDQLDSEKVELMVAQMGFLTA
jgi:hypothetical protein